MTEVSPLPQLLQLRPLALRSEAMRRAGLAWQVAGSVELRAVHTNLDDASQVTTVDGEQYDLLGAPRAACAAPRVVRGV